MNSDILWREKENIKPSYSINFSNTFKRTYKRRKIIIISNMKGRGETSFRVTKNFWNGNHDVRSEMEKKNVLFDYEKWRNDFSVVKWKKSLP